MASVSSSTLIIFIASILVAASVAGTMTSGVERLSGALGDRSADVSQEIQTDVEIISDSGSSSAIYDGSTMTLLVKNTGSQTIAADPGVLDVIVNGEYATNVSVSVVDATDWRPGSVARIEASDVDLSSGDHRVMVVVHGDEEVFEFRT